MRVKTIRDAGDEREFAPIDEFWTDNVPSLPARDKVHWTGLQKPLDVVWDLQGDLEQQLVTHFRTAQRDMAMAHKVCIFFVYVCVCCLFQSLLMHLLSRFAIGS